MNKEKYIKWYEIAQEALDDPILLPPRTDKEIIDLVSREDWLMFLIGSQNLDTAKHSNQPNVFMTIPKQSIGRIGLTFNKVGSVDVLKNILSIYCKKEKDDITKILLSLDKSWEITVSRKVKEHHFLQAPSYITEFHKECNQINDNVVDDIINISTNIREEGKEKNTPTYIETPSINLVESTFDLTEEEFIKRIKIAFTVLKICLSVKSDSEIKKIINSKVTELEQLKQRRDNLLHKLANKEKFITLGIATSEQILKAEQELHQLQQKIKNVELV